MIHATKTGIVVTAILLAVFTVYAVYVHQPPHPLPEDVPETSFSAERAIKHIEATCTRPHPAATKANERVLQYIVDTVADMGFQPRVQEATLVAGHRLETVKNVLVRVRGTAPTKALMIVAHHDSVAWGPGASDDWAGCAAMLETLRALKAGPRLRNDVIFLFTDAEERGLVGAEAFCVEHPWFEDVALVLNFEARGNTGPSYMFETGPENGWLIPHFAKAASHPFATSLMADLYLKMPTTTDYRIFKKFGLQGLNCAFIRNLAYYHTMNDSPENVDLGSLQQHGYYALDVARYFGDIELEDIRESNAVYFNALRTWLVHYPGAWATPLTILTLALFVGLVVLGMARGRLSAAGILKGFAGFGACLVTVFIGMVVVLFLANLARGRETGMSLFEGGTFRVDALLSQNWYLLYNNTLYFAAAAFLTLYIVLMFYGPLRKWVGVENLAVGVCAWWLVPLVVTTIIFPGATYLFQWPLIFAVVGLACLFMRPKDAPVGAVGATVLCLLAAPAVLLVLPSAYAMNDAMTISVAPLTALLLTMMLGLLVVPLTLLTSKRPWLLMAGSGAVGVVLFLIAVGTNTFNPEQPKLDCLSYGVDFDEGKAFWLSSDERPDEWLTQFIPPGTTRKSIEEFLPHAHGDYLKAPAPVAPLEPASIEVISDETKQGVRTVRFRLVSTRMIPQLDMYLDKDIEVLNAVADGEKVAGGKSWRLNYSVCGRKSFEVELEVKPTRKPLELIVVERYFQLPKLPGLESRPMPGSIILEPNTVEWKRDLRSKTMFVRKSHVLEAAQN